MKIYVSLSKKASTKKKNPRAAFLSVFMSDLGKDSEIIGAYASSNRTAFLKHFDALRERMLESMPKKGKGA